MAFEAAAIDAAEIVFDVVAIPSETPLIVHAREAGKHVITGLEVIALQALEQFVLYTGVRPSDEQFRKAVAFARS
ncbi:Shikimate 5-dehydrogenase-like protein [compost metagenome]